MKTFSLAVVGLSLFASLPSLAVPITVSGNFGLVEVTDGDLSRNGDRESNGAGFVVLENAATVENLTTSAISADGRVDINNTARISGTFQSLLFSFDTQAGSTVNFDGSIAFDQDIAAVIAVRNILNASDDIFGLDAVELVGADGRGNVDSTSSDFLFIDGNELTINTRVSSGADTFRVLLADNGVTSLNQLPTQFSELQITVPGPAPLAFLGGLAAVGLVLRRRRG